MKTVYLDFDGTVVEHTYPSIGNENIGCCLVIKKLQEKGYKIILNTYRADINENDLKLALDYINNPNNDLEPIIEYAPKKIHPTPWNISLLSDNIFIDDIASGIPLKNAYYVKNKMVDWEGVYKDLIKYEIL